VVIILSNRILNLRQGLRQGAPGLRQGAPGLRQGAPGLRQGIVLSDYYRGGAGGASD